LRHELLQKIQNDQIVQNDAEFALGLPAYASVAGESLLQIFPSAIYKA